MSRLESRVGFAAFADDGVAEQAHRFGQGLVGVLSQPRGAMIEKVGVILFNAGLVQRVGPFRGYVQLARAVAAAGFPVLRFDQSGHGDSPVSTTASAENRQAELHAAMALLSAETGVERFVIGGICSAADEAFNRAVDEPRVAGLLLLDGVAYRTGGFWLRHLPPRMLGPRNWRHLLRRITWHHPGADDFRDFPSRTDATRRLGSLVERDVRMLFLFTGGSCSYFNHRGQLATCLGPAARAPQVVLEHWPDCDHTFYLRQHRQRLHQLVRSWMQTNFADHGGSGMRQARLP